MMNLPDDMVMTAQFPGDSKKKTKVHIVLFTIKIKYFAAQTEKNHRTHLPCYFFYHISLSVHEFMNLSYLYLRGC